MYEPLPEALRNRLVGEEDELPDFGPADPESLKNYRVALVMTHGPELPEFHVPLNYLRNRGASVDVVTQDWLFDYQPPGTEGLVVLAQWLATNVCVKADIKISNAKIEDYDAVIFIGGAWNPIMLRTDEAVQNFIRNAHRRKLLIASICHGPQVLISANTSSKVLNGQFVFDESERRLFPRGTLVTGVDDIKVDLANAGFNVLNELVVYDEGQRLITSPNPKCLALKAFCEQIGIRLLEVFPIAGTAPNMDN